MRERARAAKGDTEQLPRISLSIPKDTPGVDTRWLDYVQTELRKAGIRHLKFGGA